MKNLGERSVRVPNRVKRGCGGLKYDFKRQKKLPHYTHNVTAICFTDKNKTVSRF